MDVYEAVRSRLTVREFKPDPVPDEVVQKMLRAVQWAPSSRNRQPWHLVVVRDQGDAGEDRKHRVERPVRGRRSDGDSGGDGEC